MEVEVDALKAHAHGRHIGKGLGISSDIDNRSWHIDNRGTIPVDFKAIHPGGSGDMDILLNNTQIDHRHIRNDVWSNPLTYD